MDWSAGDLVREKRQRGRCRPIGIVALEHFK